MTSNTRDACPGMSLPEEKRKRRQEEMYSKRGLRMNYIHIFLTMTAFGNSLCFASLLLEVI